MKSAVGATKNIPEPKAGPKTKSSPEEVKGEAERKRVLKKGSDGEVVKAFGQK